MKYEIVKEYKNERFRQITGVNIETFNTMVCVLKEAYVEVHKKRGRHRKLAMEDQLLMTLNGTIEAGSESSQVRVRGGHVVNNGYSWKPTIYIRGNVYIEGGQVASDKLGNVIHTSVVTVTGGKVYHFGAYIQKYDFGTGTVINATDVIVSGGEIAGCTVIEARSVTMSNGVVRATGERYRSDKSGSYGYGGYAIESRNVEITGGSIIAEKCSGIIDADLVMRGGEINTTEIAIRCWGTSTILVESGIISGGIHISSGTVTVTGGEIRVIGGSRSRAISVGDESSLFIKGEKVSATYGNAIEYSGWYEDNLCESIVKLPKQEKREQRQVSRRCVKASL